jgi:hypothetical protein
MIRKMIASSLAAFAVIAAMAERPAAACPRDRDNEIRVRGRTTVRYRLRRRLGDYDRGPGYYGGYGYGRGYGGYGGYGRGYYGAPGWRAGGGGGTGFRLSLGVGIFDEPFIAPMRAAGPVYYADPCPPGAIIESAPPPGGPGTRSAPAPGPESAPPPAAYVVPGPRLGAHADWAGPAGWGGGGPIDLAWDF